MKLYLQCPVLRLVTQSCPTLCNPMDCHPPGSSVHRDSLSKNTGVGCHALLEGIILTQRLNPGLPQLQVDSSLSEPGKKILSCETIEQNLTACLTKQWLPWSQEEREYEKVGMVCMCSVTQLRLTLFGSMDCRLPYSCIRGIFQARILKWIAISSSSRSS